MKKIIATTVATGLLLVGGAATASAETLMRNGANKVTITAQGAPAGAQVTKAKVTVKKGKKTVAKNKNFYKAKKGTYKVTSTVTYYVPETSTYTEGTLTKAPDTTQVEAITEDDLTSEQCVVTGRTVQNRSVVLTYSTYFGEATVRGQADVTYTGACTAFVNDSQFARHNLSWTDEWTETESVLDWVKMSQSEAASFDVQAWLNSLLATNDSTLYARHMNDVVLYPGDGTELDKAPKSVTATIIGAHTYTPGYWTTIPGVPSTTVKTTRTVVVK
jgi:hypothetical protein